LRKSKGVYLINVHDKLDSTSEDVEIPSRYLEAKRYLALALETEEQAQQTTRSSFPIIPLREKIHEKILPSISRNSVPAMVSATLENTNILEDLIKPEYISLINKDFIERSRSKEYISLKKILY